MITCKTQTDVKVIDTLVLFFYVHLILFLYLRMYCVLILLSYPIIIPRLSLCNRFSQQMGGEDLFSLSTFILSPKNYPHRLFFTLLLLSFLFIPLLPYVADSAN